MGFWSKDSDGIEREELPKNYKGRFKFDDDLRRKIDDMSNKDELLEVMDLVGDNKDSIESAIEALVSMEQSGVFDVLKGLSEGGLKEMDVSHRPRFVRNLHTILVASESMDSKTLESLTKQLPDTRKLANDLEDTPSMGPVAALRSLSDPDVKRGIGKVIVLLKALGSK